MMSYLINIDEKGGFLGQERDVLDILQYHPGLAGHNRLVFNFFVKKMFPSLPEGNSKKRLTNVVSYGFILKSFYTYRLVYIVFYLILSIFYK
jgi:hypothetical protein